MPPNKIVRASAAVTSPTRQRGRVKAAEKVSAKAPDWAKAPMVKAINRANTANSFPIHLPGAPSRASITAMGPPQRVPSRRTRQYFTASMHSANLAASPSNAASSIHTSAPGPPDTSAAATPTMLPVPTVEASAVIREPKGDTPPRPFRRASRPKDKVSARPKFRWGKPPVRRVSHTPVPKISASVPGPHRRVFSTSSIPSPLSGQSMQDFARQDAPGVVCPKKEPAAKGRRLRLSIK